MSFELADACIDDTLTVLRWREPVRAFNRLRGRVACESDRIPKDWLTVRERAYCPTVEMVRNSGAVESIFGSWPSFHDAEILRVRLDRGDSLDREGKPRKPTLEADVHVFEMTDEVTERGFYALRNHTLVTLAFHGIDELQVEGFNHQNVLFGLRLEDISDRQLEVLNWAVGFDSSFGFAATFMCEAIEVLRALPFEPPRHSAGTQLPPSPAP